MKSNRIKFLVLSLIIYFAGFFLYKLSGGSMALIIAGAVLMLIGLVLNVVFIAKVFNDVFRKK